MPTGVWCMGKGCFRPAATEGRERTLPLPCLGGPPLAIACAVIGAAAERGERQRTSRRWDTRRKLLGPVLLFLTAFGYLWAFPFHAELNNPNENVRFYMTAALIEEGTYAIDERRREWGWVNDAACVVRDEEGELHPCEPGRRGERHYYSVKAPATSFLGIPAYAAYRWWAGDAFDRVEALWAVRVGAAIVPLLLFYAFFLPWLRRRGRGGVAELVFVSVALGSPMLGYGMLFLSHSLSAAVAFGAFALLWDARREGRIGLGRATLAGLLTAGASLFEYPCFFISLILSVWALWAVRPWSRIVAFGAGALVPTGAMMHFQWSCFGNPLSPGHLFMESAAFRAIHERGFFGGTGFHPEAAGRLLFDLQLGLFALTPLLVFSLVGLVLLWRRKGEREVALVVSAIVASIYLPVCFLDNWDGGWAIGPRYLIVLYPFLGFAALLALSEMYRRWPGVTGGVAIGLTLGGLVVGGISSVYLPNPPPEFQAPMVELYGPLMQADLVPYNAGWRMGIDGLWGMAPWFAAMVFALFAAVRCFSYRGERPWRHRLKLVVAGWLVCLAFFATQQIGADVEDPNIVRAYRFVDGIWEPKSL